MPKISIIVPVYKVENYLDRCVDSLVAQTLKDIEIILVDDGSPDSCPEICDKRSLNDDRIKVIHKPNEGAGFARNTGIEHACGEFIGFVDSDDYVMPDMFEKLYTAAKNENAQIAMSGLFCIGGIMTPKANDIRRANCFDGYTVFSGKEEIDSLMLNISGALPHEKQDSKYGFGIYKNIYSHKIIKENNIRFMSEREYLSEDVFFLLDFLSRAERAVGITGAYYCYCRNESSISKSYQSDRFEKSLIMTDAINERLSQRIPKDEYKIYTDRLFQAYARVACMQEIRFARQNGISKKQLNDRLKKICGSERLKETLKSYPWYRLPIMQAAFAMTMRYSLIGLQKLLVKLKEGR